MIYIEDGNENVYLEDNNIQELLSARANIRQIVRQIQETARYSVVYDQITNVSVIECNLCVMMSCLLDALPRHHPST